MFTQGYIGISSNIPKRWNSHRKTPSNLHIQRAIAKYGWDNLIKEVVLVADRDYCLDIETKLRHTRHIGWNVANGGGIPPSGLGRTYIRTDEYREKQSKARKGLVSPNKGKPILPHVLEAMRQGNLGRVQSAEDRHKKSLANKGKVWERVICPNCNTVGAIHLMKRYHFNNCTGAKLFRAITTMNGKRVDLGRYATKEQVAMVIQKAHSGE